MDRFFQIVICLLLVALLTTCSGCSVFGGDELTDEEFIESVAEAGCNLKTIKRDDGKVGDISCHETVRHVR